MYQGGISFDIAGSLSTALLWKLSRRNLQFPLTWNNILKVTYKTPSLKLGKNVNLFYLNKNYFESKTEKVSRCGI